MTDSCSAMICKLYHEMEQRRNRMIRETGMTFAQLRLMGVLRTIFGGECDYKEMEKQLGIAQSSTVELVRKLEKKDYVESIANPTDKRRKHMKLTPAGDRMISDGMDTMQRLEGELYSGISEEELTACRSTLEKIYQNLLTL